VRFALILRAYDAGAAVRFHLLDAPGGALALVGEACEFRLPADATVYCSRDEGNYQVTRQTAVAPVPIPS
jgi:alpha-glucosidase